MKIVFYIVGLSGLGAERVCCGLANFLFQRGHEVEFLTIADDQVTYPLAEGIGRTVLLAQHERKNFLYNSFVRFCRACRFVRHTQCDCYVVMLPVTTVLLLSIRRLTKA